MKMQRARPSSKQIDTTASQFSCARPCHEKSNAPFVNQTLNFMQKQGQTLDLVYYDDSVMVREFFLESLWTVAERKENIVIEQIVYACTFQRLPHEKCLSCLAGAKEKVRFLP